MFHLRVGGGGKFAASVPVVWGQEKEGVLLGNACGQWFPDGSVDLLSVVSRVGEDRKRMEDVRSSRWYSRVVSHLEWDELPDIWDFLKRAVRSRLTDVVVEESDGTEKAGSVSVSCDESYGNYVCRVCVGTEDCAVCRDVWLSPTEGTVELLDEVENWAEHRYGSAWAGGVCVGSERSGTDVVFFRSGESYVRKVTESVAGVLARRLVSSIVSAAECEAVEDSSGRRVYECSCDCVGACTVRFRAVGGSD